MAIGDHSVATDANSVAIGYQSQSAPATSVNSASVMTTSITSGAPIATHTYSGFAGVGSSTKGFCICRPSWARTSKFKNVAAGEISATSTDAVMVVNCSL